MRRMSKVLCCVLTLVLALCCVPSEIISSASDYDWVGSWGTPAIESGVVLGEDSDISEAGFQFRDVIPAGSTVRTVVTPTLSGIKVRLKFSNEYGNNSVTINETTIAYTGETDDLVDADSITQITFNGGQKAVKIAAGSEVYSDEISFKVTALKKVSISCYYSSTTPMYTTGLYGGTSYLASSLGNRTHKESMTSVATRLDFTSSSITYHTIPFLTRLDVYAMNSYCVVLLGDSTLTNDLYLMLAEKCINNGITNVGFIMSGIIGNALLRDGKGLLGKAYGDSLLDRAGRDAFNIPGVEYVIVKIGENDILHPMLDSMQGILPDCSPLQVTNGYGTLAKQFKDTGIKVYLCTKTPYNGYTRNFLGGNDLTWTQAGENKLLEINKWIKNSAASNGYSGYINLDALRDPDDSTKLRAHMTSDGIHFTSYGQIAVTDLIQEAAYGVNKELKNYSDIVNIDPYVAPKVEATTKAEASTNKNETPDTNQNNSQNSASETTTAVQNNSSANTNNSSAELTTYNAGIPVGSVESTTASNANQILIGDDFAGSSGLIGSVSDDSSKYSKQMAGFALLAVAAIIIIVVATVMLTKLSPSRKSLGRASYNGRAKQKRRV